MDSNTAPPAIALTPVESSRIAAIGHEGDVLAVQFKRKDGSLGPTYHYPGVGADVYAAFNEAESKGKFFESNVRPLKVYNRVAEPPAPEAA